MVGDGATAIMVEGGWIMEYGDGAEDGDAKDFGGRLVTSFSRHYF